MSATEGCQLLLLSDTPCPQTATARIVLRHITYRVCAEHRRRASDKGYPTRDGLDDVPSFLDPDELEPNGVTFDDPPTSDREAW